jgi:hypothetical protein
MTQPLKRFWMVMRLSRDDEVQQPDSLPRFKHDTLDSAIEESTRLAESTPGARGFVVLQAAYVTTPVVTTSSITLAVNNS